MMKRNLPARQTTKGDKEEEVVTLRVSHPNLADNIRAGMNVGIEVAGDIKHRLELQKKMKD